MNIQKLVNRLFDYAQVGLERARAAYNLACEPAWQRLQRGRANWLLLQTWGNVGCVVAQLTTVAHVAAVGLTRLRRVGRSLRVATTPYYYNVVSLVAVALSVLGVVENGVVWLWEISVEQCDRFVQSCIDPELEAKAPRPLLLTSAKLSRSAIASMKKEEVISELRLWGLDPAVYQNATQMKAALKGVAIAG
jgi:hypothetical protein